MTCEVNAWPLPGSKSRVSWAWRMLCHKCHQATPAEGDSWCLGCAGWKALGRELCSPWPSEGARRLAADLVISRARQVRGLRNFAQAVRSNQASSQAAARKREADENQEDQIDLSSRGASLQLLTHRCWEQRPKGPQGGDKFRAFL